MKHYMIEEIKSGSNVKTVVFYLQEGKRGLTILHIASESNNITMASFLLQQPSIEVNQLSYDGKTALDLAVSRMLSEMQQILEESGATSGPRSEPNSDSEDDDELVGL